MRTKQLLFYTGVVILSLQVPAQSPVQQYFTNYKTRASTVSSYSILPANPGSFSSCNTITYTYNWSSGSSNLLNLNSVSVNGKTMIVAPADSVEVKLNRVNNAVVSEIRNIVYGESTTAVSNCVNPRTLNFKVPYEEDMTVFLNNTALNQGTDNLFTNASNSSGNNNNIERVDVVFRQGISSPEPADAGFVLCERGANNSHDGFRIAAILAIDGSGNPTSFGPVKTCVSGNGSNNGSWGHPSIANGNISLAAYILRKDPSDAYMRVSSQVTQEIGGVFFSLSDLEVAANQVIYGYILIGPDGTANPTSAHLLNLNDAAVYPTGTTEAQGGGLDLIAISSFFGTNQALKSEIKTSFRSMPHRGEWWFEWEISNVTGQLIVQLERSSDAVSFYPVHSYQASGFSAARLRDYPPKGIFYYRLKIIEASGRVIYGRTLRIQVNPEINWKLYPNVARAGEVIFLEGLPDGLYEATLVGYDMKSFNMPVVVENGKGRFRSGNLHILPGNYVLMLRRNGEWIGQNKKIIFLNK